MIDDGREVGGPIELNRLKALMVSVEDALHAITVGVLRVAVLRTTAAQRMRTIISSDGTRFEKVRLEAETQRTRL